MDALNRPPEWIRFVFSGDFILWFSVIWHSAWILAAFVYTWRRGSSPPPPDIDI